MNVDIVKTTQFPCCMKLIWRKKNYFTGSNQLRKKLSIILPSNIFGNI